MTKTQQLTTDAEEVLAYLHKTERRVERTKQALREACHMADTARANRALRQLLTGGFLTETDGVYELTASGLQTARVLQNRKSTQIMTQIGRVEGGNITVSGVQDILTTPLDYKSLFTTQQKPVDDDDDTAELLDRTLHTSECGVPNYTFHPLRISGAILHQAGSAQRKQAVVLRYVLAFEHPQDALPVPILHGDVLGRSKIANVWLKSDDFISNRHCRFEIRTESGGKFSLYVEDLGSRNGTFVDNIQLEEGKPVRLRHGSKLQVGSTVLIVMQIPY